jgi:hypothetical protein
MGINNASGKFATGVFDMMVTATDDNYVSLLSP